MSKIKSQLKYGLLSDGSTPEPARLTRAARDLAASALAELDRLGVAVTLETGRARFRGAGLASSDVRRMIERHGDLIEAFLVDRRRHGASRQ
jgi:hypothetical protein